MRSCSRWLCLRSSLPSAAHMGFTNVSTSNQPLNRQAKPARLGKRWAPGASGELDLKGGGEFFVLEGCFNEGGDQLERESWLRLPADGYLRATAGRHGCRVWVKTGHLPPRFTAPVRSAH